MLVISHRGYHASLPENTLAAFAAAVRLGVDGIETDLRVSADGHTVLYHDHLTPDGRPVAKVSHAELSRLAGFEVPTVESALEQFPQLLWNLEIKVPAALEPALRLVADFGASRQLLVTSFQHQLIEEVARRCQVECGWLVSHRPLRLFTENPRVRTTVWYFETLDAELLSESRHLGLRNFVYGVTTPGEHAQCREFGLDGVITDWPERCACAAGDT